MPSLQMEKLRLRVTELLLRGIKSGNGTSGSQALFTFTPFPH